MDPEIDPEAQKHIAELVKMGYAITPPSGTSKVAAANIPAPNGALPFSLVELMDMQRDADFHEKVVQASVRHSAASLAETVLTTLRQLGAAVAEAVPDDPVAVAERDAAAAARGDAVVADLPPPRDPNAILLEVRGALEAVANTALFVVNAVTLVQATERAMAANAPQAEYKHMDALHVLARAALDAPPRTSVAGESARLRPALKRVADVLAQFPRARRAAAARANGQKNA